MSHVSAVLRRRLVLAALAALPLAAALPRQVAAAAGAEAILIALADLHSAYARLPALLSGIRAIPAEGGDSALAELIAAAKAEHPTDAEREVIAKTAHPRDLPASILIAAEAVRAAVEADIAFLGHTTFGAPLAAGPLTRYDFDAFIRFDGDIRVAEVPGETLAAILARANQHLATRLEERTGDFVHARAIDIDPAQSYRVATNGWTAQNQAAYLGTTDLDFRPVDGAMLKAIVAAALARGI